MISGYVFPVELIPVDPHDGESLGLLVDETEISGAEEREPENGLLVTGLVFLFTLHFHHIY